MSNSAENKIDKKDFFRVLVTETIPFETPIIYSNDGLYKNCDRHGKHSISNDFFDFLVLGNGKKKVYTIPYQYKIRKNDVDYRKLSVLHPISQMEIKEFYKKFSTLICHFCSRSSFSIRAPKKIASTFYYKNSWEDIKKFKRGSVSNVENELLLKHSTSYFSYSGYDRIYKFYNSVEFIGLERDYPSFWTLDVSKCFDSIYTHSISWATKDKKHVKIRMGTIADFGYEFDSLMQRSNYNETNGIVIGPEVSRVFAEIIFQKIDSILEEKLLSDGKPLIHGRDYKIKRYVDDVFIFGVNETVAKQVYEMYSDCLSTFNLHVNKSKSLKYQRPFFSVKSKLILRVGYLINDFIDKFIGPSEEENLQMIPKRIFRKSNLINNFIDSIKSACVDHQVTYDEVSSYIISSLFERIKRLVVNDDKEYLIKNEENIKDAFLVFIEVMFFFYSVSPSVTSSYKLCSSLIIINRFSELNFNIYSTTIKQKIHERAISLFSGELLKNRSKIDGFVFLEAINVALTIGELGEDYSLSSDVLEGVFSGHNTYYNLISCLFIVKDFGKYNDLKIKTISLIAERLSDLYDIQTDAEICSLFLDSISCPYISNKFKHKWIRDFYKVVQKKAPLKADIDDFLASMPREHWFVDWQAVDLLNALERKELKKTY